MGACTTKSQRKEKRSGSSSATAVEDQGLKHHEKASFAGNGKVDQFFERYEIEEAQFKALAAAKASTYYAVFYKLRNLAASIGEVNSQTSSSSLCKTIAKVKLISEKVERDFRTASFKRASPTLPITDEEILVYSLKYSKITIDAFDHLAKDPKYEELFPILSFGFRDVKTKLKEILSDTEKQRAQSSKKGDYNNLAQLQQIQLQVR